MKAITIGKKLYFSFGLVLALFLATGIYAVSQVSGLDAAFDEVVEVYNKMDRLAAEADILLLTARRHEKDFLARRDQKYITKMKATSARFSRNLKTLAGLAQKVGMAGARPPLQQMATGLDAYKKGFARIVTLIKAQGDKDHGIRGTLRRTAHHLERNLKRIGADRLLVMYLMLRRHEKDFVLRHDPKYVSRARRVGTEMQSSLAASRAGTDLKASARRNLDSYLNGLGALSRNIAAIEEQYPVMRTAAHRIEKGSRDLMTVIDGHLHTKVKTASAAAHQSEWLILTAVGAAVLVGLILAVLIVLSIARPVKKVLAVSEAVAAGDYNQEIDVRSRDEIGRLARSLKQTLAAIIRKMGEGQSIQQGIPDPMFVTDRERTVIYMNQACSDLVGRTSEEVVGQLKCHDIFQADACETSCVLKHCMSTGERMVGAKCNIYPGGKEIPVVVSGNALRDLNGEIMGGMEFIRDISADVEAQQMIEQQQNDLLAVAQEVARLAEQLASAAAEISASTEQMSAGTEEQSAQTETVSTAVQQMSAAVHQSATNAALGAEQARKAGQIATEGGEVVEKTVEAMTQISRDIEEVGGTVQDLATKSEQIDKVVAVIEDIADQTNLLALNAAIEAARAGEAGRGFAVVADEVRKLAEKTMSATKEVGETVRSIKGSTEQTVRRVEATQQNVTQGVDLAGTAGQMLQEIVTNATKVTEMVIQIATAAEEQTAATEEITRNVEGIASGAQESAHAVAETARSAEELSSMATHLNETVDRFNGHGQEPPAVEQCEPHLGLVAEA